MKKDYTTPTIFMEEFCADEYIAACDHTKRYFNCNAGYGGGHTLKFYENGSLKTIYDYGPCDEYHEVTAKNSIIYTYFNGWYDDYLPVIICKHYVGGRDGYLYHATTELNKETWETTKS